MEQRQNPIEQRKNPVELKPVFMPRVNSDNLVKTDMVRVERHVGFASRQKKKLSMTCIKLSVRNTALIMS